MNHRFPKDCNGKCPHIGVRDLSIDDLVIICRELKMSCDACDEDFSFLLCPLSDEERRWEVAHEPT